MPISSRASASWSGLISPPRSSRTPTPGEKEPWIAIRRRLYLADPPCKAVLRVEPLRVEIAVDLRTDQGWQTAKLTRLEEELIIPSCGLKCLVGDVYDGTPLNRRRSR
jgi:hypothetical protein